MKINFLNGQVANISEEAETTTEEASAQINEETPQSVELTISQRGHYSGKVKVYAKTPEEALKKASQIALSIETIIREKNDTQKQAKEANFKKVWEEVKAGK